MAENAPEQQDRGLFGVFGKKDEHQQAPLGNVEHHHETGPAAASVNTTEHIHSAHEEPLKHGSDGGGMMSKIKEKLPGHQTGPPGVSVNTTEHIRSVHEEPPKHGFGEGGGGIMNKLHSNDNSTTSFGEEGGDGKEEGGMIERIKEKLPGGQKTEEQHYRNEQKQYQAEEGVKKEGFMDKIKDKLPGNKKEGEY